MDIFKDIINDVISGNQKKIVSDVEIALNSGVSPLEVLNEGLIKGMDAIADAWRKNEIFIPEVLVAARAMAYGNKVLEPLLVQTDRKKLGTVVIGTVKGDLHDIGKNLVAMMLKGKGFDVVDLGVNVTKEQFIAAVEEHKADFVCLSTLLTTTMLYFKDVIEYFKEKDLRDKVKIFIGGAPITEAYAEEIGADVYTEDAVTAAEVMFNMVNA
jgi:5-methyltetrahydrofolate--homocysteine methyltransferase